MKTPESLAAPSATVLEPPKKQRIISLDLARGIAMVFVVVIHCIEQVSSEAVKSSFFGGIAHMGTSMCAAAMFMFLMGVGVSFSRSTTFFYGVRRGLLLILLAYILNILRGTLPTYAGLAANMFTLEDLKPNTPLSVAIEIDILHFAGLALILMAIIRKMSKQWLVWLGAGVVVLLLCPFVYGHKVASPLLNYAVNFLWRTEEYSHFPLMPWLAYPLFGMVFGHFLKSSKNPQVFFIRSAVVGSLLCLIGGYMAYNYSDFSMDEWLSGAYNEGAVHPWWVVFESGVLLVSLFFYQLLAIVIPRNKVFDWLCFWSKEVTLMYCIQWILIGWIVVFIPAYFGFAATFLCILVVFFLTHHLGKAWKKISNEEKGPLEVVIEPAGNRARSL
jgi:uncharacterized membrane protein